MAIQYQQENQLFSLNTKHTTYQMKVDSKGFLFPSASSAFKVSGR